VFFPDGVDKTVMADFLAGPFLAERFFLRVFSSVTGPECPCEDSVNLGECGSRRGLG